LVVAVVVLKFNHASVVTVGVLTGVLFLAFAVEEFVLGLESSTPPVSSLTTLLALKVEEQVEPARVREILHGVLDEYNGVPALAEQAAVLATFDGPARAARCGLAIIERAAAAGLRVSVGLHTAEVARHGATVSGAGVAVVQSVADARAEVRPRRRCATTAGSGLAFETGPRSTYRRPAGG
jgi:hypothetical protein